MHYNLLMSQRCIILCNGYYLWKKTSKSEKTPFYFNYIENEIQILKSRTSAERTIKKLLGKHIVEKRTKYLQVLCQIPDQVL